MDPFSSPASHLDGNLCEEELPTEKLGPVNYFGDLIEPLFPLFYVSTEYSEDCIPYAAQEEVQTDVGNEYIWSEDVKLLKLENYTPQEEIEDTEAGKEKDVSLKDMPMEQVASVKNEICEAYKTLDEREIEPSGASKDCTKPKQTTYSREKYRRMLMLESEVDRTRRLAKHREYKKKYQQKKREEGPKRGPRRDRWRETEQDRQKMLLHNEKRKRLRQQETPEQRARRLNHMKEYKRKMDQKKKENRLKMAMDLSDSDGRSCEQSSQSNITTDNHNRSAVAMERRLPRLEVRLERIDVKKFIEDLRAPSNPPVAADYNYYSS